MNVMAEAHKETKLLIQSMSAEGQAQVKSEKLYGRMFAINLKRFHKEYKAMQKNEQGLEAWKDDMIAKAQARIVSLNEVSRQGYIVIIGDENRVCIDVEAGEAINIEKASVFMYIEDARYWANRVQNGAGEKGSVTLKHEQIKWEIEQQYRLIENLKVAF